jgi:ABC-type transporter Mla subunit MlaD
MPSLPTPGEVFRAARAQTEALAALPGALVSLTRAVAQLDGTMREVRAAVGRLERLGERLEGVLDELEQPIRDLAPGLARIGAVLDDPVVSEIPDTVRRIREDMLPLVATLRGTSDMLDRFSGLSLLGGRRRPEPPGIPPERPGIPPPGPAVLPGGVPDQ